MGPLEWLNCGLAAVGGLVALGAIDRMNRLTECTIIAAFVTTAAGLFGYAIGSLMPAHWQQVFDTLLLGGAVAVLIGTRKHTVWIAPAWMPWISLGVSSGSWILFFAAVS